MRRFVLAICLAFAALLGAGIASADLAQKGNTRVSFNASFAPHSLPRERAGRLTVHMQSKIKAVDGGRPPTLRRFAIAINRYGIVSTRGLPTCDASEIAQTTTQQARSRCGGALVGHGRFEAYLQ